MKLNWKNNVAVVEFREKVSGDRMKNGFDPAEGLSRTIELDPADALLAVYQHKEWWTRPCFPKRFSEIPKRSQLVLLKYPGEYIAVLAVTADIYRADLEGAEEGICVRISSNEGGLYAADTTAAVFVRGKNPYECVRMASVAAVDRLGHPDYLREKKKYPEIFDYLGWCTWNAFYRDVSEEKIVEKLKEFREKQIPVKWVLIDDGWADNDFDSEKLQGLDACPSKFPKGLGHAVRKIKSEYGIPYVGVWHSIMGYWNGVKKDSKADHLMSDSLWQLSDGRKVVAPDRAAAFRFYDCWHDYLRSKCGIDFVKVDGQSSTSQFYKGMVSYGKASGEIQEGLNASVALHFGDAVIHCMGMAPEEVWKRKGSMINRSSDDYLPDEPHSFREHAIQNAYSGIWAGNFQAGDWDMYFSEQEESTAHGILRAISGGPVYTSDEINRSDAEAISRLVRKDGRVLRCDDGGLPTADCLFEDPIKENHVLKVFNRHEKNWYIAAFNISEDEKNAEFLISTRDIPELAGKNWILFNEKEESLTPLSDTDSWHGNLDAGESVMFEIMPETKIGVVGIRGKYIMDACVEILHADGAEILARVLEPGDLLLYASEAPVCDCISSAVVNTENAFVTFDAEPVAAKVQGPEKHRSGMLYQIPDVHAGDILRLRINE